MRSARKRTFLAIFLIALGPELALADRPTPAELSTLTLQGHLRGLPSERIEQTIEREAFEVMDSARARPDEIRGATVIFKDGKTPAALDELASRAQIDVSSVELKVSAGDEGRVFTIWIGEDLLLLLNGSLRERLEKAIGRQRYQFLTLAGSAPDGEAALFEEVAYSQEMHIYKAGIVGPAAGIAALLDDPTVAAITLDDTSERVASFSALKEEYGRSKVDSMMRVTTPDPESLSAAGQRVLARMRGATVIQR
ncbi:MAG TPA: hypothetical protein VF339_18920 [Gammaproteobacteria bacterium]